jgi:transcription elongation factor GreA
MFFKAAFIRLRLFFWVKLCYKHGMPQYFTKEGLQKLKDELAELKGPEMKKVVALISEAAAFGDLKENSAYHEARNMKSFLLGRIEQLENAINEAIIKEKSGENKVQIGSIVQITLGGSNESYVVVSPTEADILKNKISYQSPLGQALMGKQDGQAFRYYVNGKNIAGKIIKIG